MPHHRCSKCRNPIRSVAVARPCAGEAAWYHPDCWAEACASEQENYERQVRAVGLEALLAPYVSARVAAATIAAGATASPTFTPAAGPGFEQAQG